MAETTQGVQLNFRDDPELYELINQYRKSLGWTWKRLFLTGSANSIIANGNNTDLVLRIADYLENNR